MRDLLGPGLVDTSSLPPDERAAGFDNNADVLGTSDLLVEQGVAVAEKAAAVVAGDLGRYLPCATATPDVGCAESFVRDFGRRAWRRPLEDAEVTALVAVFDAGQADAGFGDGIGRVVEVLLDSPQFLYRIELGAGASSDLAGAVRLTPYEGATRLAYLIWGSMPDDSLLGTAAADRLSTAEDLAREARRLLADPRAHDMVSSFHAQWLGLAALDDLDKDKVVYPLFDPSLRAAFRAETERFVDEVIWNREGTLGALLSARYTFVDQALASFYGVPFPGGDGLVRVNLDSAHRAGIITQASNLAVHAKANQSSPVHRGRFVREQLFCTTPPPPPSDIEIRPPALDPALTTRQRFAQHTADTFCAGCHVLLDPIGFGFEHYDGLGRWRETESGNAIDATGMLSDTDTDGPFDGAVELALRLAGSAEVERCYARQWFRYGYGRGETSADACALAQLMTAANHTRGDVRELIVALTQTDAFRYRRQGEGQAP